jgi:hypothetical protein
MKLKQQIWLAAVLFYAALVCVGCGRSEKSALSKIESIDLNTNKLQPAPIQQTSLTDDQLSRIKRLRITFSEADPSPLEKWIEDFKRDANPESEIRHWEGMAAVYQTFIAGKNLSLDAKKDVYRVLLLRSGGTEQEVLPQLKLKVLTEQDAKEIMAHFIEKPPPEKVIKQ